MYVDFDLLAIVALGAGGVALVRLSRKVFGSYFAPASIYSALWMFSLAVFYLALERFYALEPEIVAVLLFTVFMFMIGSIIARTRFQRTTTRHLEHEAKDLKYTSYLKYIIYGLFILSLLGTIVYYTRLNDLISIDSLWLDPARVRYEESIGDLRRLGLIAAFRSLMVPVFALAVLYFRVDRTRRNTDMWIIAIMSFLITLPSSGRTTIATELAWAGLIVVYVSQVTGRRIAPAKGLLGLVLVGVLFLGYFLVTTNLQKKSVYGQAGLSDLTIYTVSSFPAFQEMVKYPVAFEQHGTLTFGAVARVLNEIDPANYPYPEYVQPVVSVPGLTNIYTYLDSFFLDFGWIGVVIFPFLLGFITSATYLWMLDAPSISKVYFVSLMGFCIIQTTTANRFGSFQTWLWIIFPLGLIKLTDMVASARAKSLSPGSIHHSSM